ncbi:unnamed protein product, partial [Mesorhabditis belari]|uniref:ER membrane protein complex subunit 1 n=1 Tax=Mesorhabditis belari TaxID=2138241 RepID=A0AAF3F4K9_9BILA
MVLYHFLLLLVGAHALFEDQVGKFDWRKQFIGCPTQIEVDRRGKLDRYLMATEENVVAALSMNTGEIVWRKVQEDTANQGHRHAPTFAGNKNAICTVSDSGRMLRIWSKRDGAFLGQLLLSSVESPHPPAVAIENEACLVVAHNRAIAVSLKDATKLWEIEINKSNWVAARPHRDGFAIVGGIQENSEVHVKWVDAQGNQNLNRILSVNSFNPKRVTLSGRHLLGHWDSTLYSLDILANGPEMKIEVVDKKEQILEVVQFATEGYAAVRTTEHTAVLNLAKNFAEVLSTGKSDAVSEFVNKDGVQYVALVQNHVLTVFDLNERKEILKQVAYGDPTLLAPVKKVVVGGGDKEWEFLVIGEDCRMDHLVVDLNAKKGTTEWSREEGLTKIGSVEMLDLPLSESQAAIETEFSVDEKNVLASFIHRLISQLDQFKRWIGKSFESIFNLALVMQVQSSSFSDILNSVRNSAKSSSSFRGYPLERDVFNLRKLMVVTSLKGSIFALDNSDGSVVWRKYLGANVDGLTTLDGHHKIPIFIQRTTAFYNFDAQVAVAYKQNAATHITFLNPMNGKEVDHQVVNDARRIDLLPFVGDNHLHSIIVVGANKKFTVFPSLPANVLETAPPVHLFDVDQKNGKMTGFRLDLKTHELKETWTEFLPQWQESTLITISGKPSTQRTHSQGRVMVDRSVLYKYVNPNLVAIALLGKESSQLTVIMLDAVTGQTVHSARLPKVKEPVHLVHCENWVAYSYWSEKGRRTEIAVFELFQGIEQQHLETFSSDEPLKQALHVEQASFIFSQGIQSMAISETEQGASNRAILVALPFGNIFEVNRRILDALRPMELTAEMREEGGFIPYMPEIPIATEEMLNYNQTVHHIQGIKTAPSGLESTSLVLAYGLDMFYTRVTPSGTFDILKDDFDHVFITIVLAALILGSIFARRMARNKALQQQWA